MKTYTKDELSKILELHRLFLENDPSGVHANLEDVDLRNANLNGADLRYANLEGANLENSDLRNANLNGADLRHVNLNGADLRYADLRNANLEEGANLKGAILEGANLRYADLRNANLEGANLENSDLRNAILEGANLKGAILDYSSWPLWCGSFEAKVDTRIAAQLAYHFCRLHCDDPEYIKARNAIVKFANKFHRVGEYRIPEVEEI